MKKILNEAEFDVKNECPVKHAHQFISGKWRIGILWSLRNEARRFGQLKRDVPGISEKMLIQELKHLQSLDVIRRKAYNELPPRVEYRLAKRGESLIPLIENVIGWSLSDIKSNQASSVKK